MKNSNRIVEYDQKFLCLSYEWLNDEEIRKLTMAKPVTKEAQINWYNNLKDRNDYLIFGVLHNSIPCGVVGLKNIDNVIGKAEYFGYIGEKQFWRKGIGHYMLDSMCELASSKGLRKIYLTVSIDNKRAIKVYEANGFVKVRTDAEIHIMEKLLNKGLDLK